MFIGVIIFVRGAVGLSRSLESEYVLKHACRGRRPVPVIPSCGRQFARIMRAEELAVQELHGGLARVCGRRLVGCTIAQQGVALVAVARELEPSRQEGVPELAGDVEHGRLGSSGKIVAVDESSRVGLGAAEGAGFREAEF